MRSRARRLAGPAAILGSMLVAATPTPVEALEAPTGVLFDGRVTVVVVGSAGPDSGSEMAIADASVTVVATAFDGTSATPVGAPLTAVTAADGSVELTGVARAADGRTDVRLAVDAVRRTETTDAAGCTRTEVWAGDVTGIPAVPRDPIVVPARLTVTTVCDSGPVIEGRLLAASGDPLAVEAATVEVAAPDAAAVTIALTVGADGAFLAELPPLGTWTEPATVTLRAMGAVTRSEPFGRGCVRTLADAVTWSQPAALAEGATIPPLELTAAERVVAERCRAVATAAPGPVSAAPSPGPTRTPAATRQPVAPTTASPTPTEVAIASAARTRLPRAGAVAGRTGFPAPDTTPAQPATDAGAPAGTTATPEMVALLIARVTMAVTLVIVMRITRRA